MNMWVNVVLIFPRYFLITGLTVLALVFFSADLRSMGTHIDFEMILPYALDRFVPAGLMGLIVAGLLAAFMSNFAATVNAAPPLHRQRHLQALHQPPRRREDLRAPQLRRLARGGDPGGHHGLVRRFHQRGDPVDHGRALGRLHRVERAQVVLVAVQRIRLLLGHGDRHRGVPGAPGGAAVRAHDPVAPQLLSHHPRALPDRMLRGHPAHAGRGRSGPHGLLPPGAAVGVLGPDPRQGPRGGPGLPPEPRLLAGHVQHRARHLLADEPRGPAHLHRDPQVERGAHGGRRSWR